MNKEDMTKRVIAGLSYKKAKILAHPTGRLLNNRNGYELDWEKIFDYCKKNDKALEINSWPDRLDLPDSLVRQAVVNGVKMVINTDSHESSQMELMRYGVSVARRGWATKNDILNTLSYNEFIDWLNK
jgi:DNA polymerase (family 10)